jgi:hypothetical protein
MRTQKQQRVVDFISKYPNQFTYREIGEKLKIKRSTLRDTIVEEGLTKLVKSGRSFKGGGQVRKATKAERDFFEKYCAEHNLPFKSRRLWWHKTKEVSASFYDPLVVDDEKKARKEFLKRIRQSSPRTRKSPVPTKTLAIPANFDIHIGKHCELIRSGREYTPDMAVKRVLEGQASLFEMTKPFGVSDILLPMGNDIVNVDNNSNTTTGGTPQDVYGSLETQALLAAELYIRSIEQWSKTHNVWLCHVHSNHDRFAGWSVSEMVRNYFAGSKNKRVHAHERSFSQEHRKYFIFGDSLIMFQHGEAKEEKILGVIKSEAGEALAKTNRIYVYQGHTHHKTVSRRGMNTEVNMEKDHSGLTVIKSGSGAVNQMHVETVRSPSPSDDWHSRNQFVNMPAIELFLHDKHTQFARFTHWFQ